MNQVETSTKDNHGATAGIIASVMAILGFFTFAIIFVPLALIFMLFGFLFAIIGRSGAGFGWNVLALVLTLMATLTSPLLLAYIGLQSLALTL